MYWDFVWGVNLNDEKPYYRDTCHPVNKYFTLGLLHDENSDSAASH